MNNLLDSAGRTFVFGKSSPACGESADRFPTADISYIGDYVLSPELAPHWSCENCGAVFLRASLPFRMPRYALPACRLLPLQRSLRVHSTLSQKLGESDEH